jgi:hypothetical protein
VPAFPFDSKTDRYVFVGLGLRPDITHAEGKSLQRLAFLVEKPRAKALTAISIC